MKFLKRLGRGTWELLKWLGRVTLWVVFFPLGLWASISHSRRKAIKRAVAEARKAS